jgi:hypothetical protein
MKPIPRQRLDKHVTVNNNSNIGRCVFSVVRAVKTTGRPRQLVVGSFRVNTRRSEQINSGTSFRSLIREVN